MIIIDIEKVNKWFDNLDGEKAYYTLGDYVQESGLSYEKLWRLLSVGKRLEIYNWHKTIEEIEGAKK